MKIRFQTLIAAAAGTLAAGIAQAQVPWVPPNGAGSFFTYTGGLSDNGLFGNPILVGDQFQFTPANYLANSVNGVAASVTDRIQVDLTANPGRRFTMIRITEFGNYNLVGLATVNASGSLNLVDMNNVRPPAIQALSANPAMPFTATNVNGQWSGTAVINLAAIIGPDWTRLRLVFSNTLQASSSPGGSALITKKVVQGPSIFVEILPTPGAASILGLGLVMASRRRRA